MKKMLVGSLLLLLLLLLVGCKSGSSEDRQVIRARGSSTLLHAAKSLSVRYKAAHPEVTFVVTGGDSGHGIDEMMVGRADIANASRKIKSGEVENARAVGITPTEHIVAHDAVAIVVHPDNPLSEITFSQLAEIFAEDGRTKSWDALGVEIPGCESGEMVAVGRPESSGTRAFFSESVLDGRKYGFSVLEQESNDALLDLIRRSPCGIAYASAGSVTADLRSLRVCETAGGTCQEPSVDNVVAGAYPLARPLFMYTRGDDAIESWVKEYIDWIMTDEGQCILVDSGFAPTRVLRCT